jgi:hypothetical protein
LEIPSVSDGRRIATFTHDQGGQSLLHAYFPEPAEVTRQGEQMANRLYGNIETRSPKTPYFGSWRDPEPTRFRAGPDAGPPLKIFMVCNFGTEPWAPPANLAEHAAQMMQRDEANVMIGWERREERFVMDRLEVAINNLAEGRNFRSVWYGDEVGQLSFDWLDIAFPTSPADPIGVNIAGKLQRRYNKGEAPTAATATFSMSGTLPPIPDWVLY